jgi:hypothetical protein
MTIKSNRKAWLIYPTLAAALALVSGCAPEESAPKSAPSAPPVPPETNPVEPGKTSKLEQDLKKDLGGPVLKPDATTTPPAETNKP